MMRTIVASTIPAKKNGVSIERQVDHRIVVEDTVECEGGLVHKITTVDTRAVSDPLPEWEARGLAAQMNGGLVAQTVMAFIEITPDEVREDAGFPITL